MSHLPEARDRFLARVLASDGHGAHEIAARLVEAGHDPVELVSDVLAPGQEAVGQAWERDEVTVAQEHAATAIVDDVLGWLTTRLPGPGTGFTIALVCAENEWHATPARMASIVWRARGWRVWFLGASSPTEHLRTTLQARPPDVLAVSCTIPLALPGAASVATVGRDLGIPVLAGGRAFGPDAHRARTLGFDDWAPSARDALPILNAWLDAPPAPAEPFVPDAGAARLRTQRAAIVAAAMDVLADVLPPVRSYTPRQRARTVEDLEYILDFAAVTLDVDDPRLFDQFTRWLVGVLAVRGVPASALDAGLRVLVDLTGHLPRVTELLTASRRLLSPSD